VRLVFSVGLALACAAATASAQTKGRIGVGGSVTFNGTTDGRVGSVTTAGPLIRINPHKGWAPVGALNWFTADLENPSGGSGDFGRLRARPLMGGVRYSVETGAILTSFSIVAGPSFNKAEFEKSYQSSGESIDADTSFAVRPGVGITWTVAPRVAIVGFGGFLINRPDVVYRNRAGQEFRDQWKADAVVLSVGAVYSVF
jgi:hypothetical protein